MAKGRPKHVTGVPRKASEPVKKAPVVLTRAGDYSQSHPTWRVSRLDLEHDRWGWHNLNVTGVVKVLEFLKQMEQLTWREIQAQQTGTSRRGALHKYVPLESLCGAAQDRLTELNADDGSDLFRFRLGNMPRLWGLVEEATFYPLWWDPRHEVCPSVDTS
ncbi:MAG TPA: hypothetical protein VGP46_14140 [Acidimicrobiales bacterium]|jgi:hypothetical protein|nr:hypothetical protein [Acidimicrobiales bacterium]